MSQIKNLVLLIIIFTMGCSSPPKVPMKAVYLVRGVGQLSREDLQAHPEVSVTDNFDKLKEIVQTKVAIWIDITQLTL